jgi:ribonuclease BN (tRNA processing enzyme)
MQYDVISTGSKGNAVVVNDTILIDCGVPFKALKGVYKGLKLVLLTHIHSDHFNKTTIRALARERPTLRFGCCEWLVKPLADCGVEKRNIDVYKPDSQYGYRDFCLIAFELTHDVPNCGYKICVNAPSGATTFKNIFYATDCANLDGIEAKGYDLYLIEANHGKAEIGARIYNKVKAGEYAYEKRARDTHLSREAAEDFIYRNIKPNGLYVFLHCHEAEGE